MENINFDVSKGYEILTGKLEEWLKTAVKMLPNFVVAILVLLLFVFAAKMLRGVFRKVFAKITDNKSLQGLLTSILYIAIIAIGTFIALTILNLDGAVTSLLAGAGVIGLALGFAFQDIAANFISGTMMSIRKPFKIGDLIKSNDYFGKVKAIHLRATEIQTMQGQIILIPNSQVFQNPIENFSELRERRVDLEVGVTYGEDLQKAKDIALETVRNIEGVDADRVDLYYTGFGGSSINFTVRYWLEFSNKQFEYWAMVDKGVMGIKKAFDENDIPIPFPIRTLDFGDVDFQQIFSTFRETSLDSKKVTSRGDSDKASSTGGKDGQADGGSKADSTGSENG